MINPDTFLLAEISENIKSLQLQLDYEKSRLTTALGGDPVLYDVAGPGAIIGGSAKIGTGSAIAGATMQIDGDLVIGDGAGLPYYTIGTTHNTRHKAVGNGTVSFGASSTGCIKTSSWYYNTVPSGSTVTIATVTPSPYQVPLLEIFGYGYEGSNKKEFFRVYMSRLVGEQSMVKFESIGSVMNGVFLAQGDFTVTDDGTVISYKYTNNEASGVFMNAKLVLVTR